MKKLTFLFLTLLSFTICFSQTATIRGIINDTRTEEGLAFGNVSLLNDSLGAVTDLNGYFRISHIPEGEYSLKISYVGYRDSTIHGIQVKGDTVITLTIQYPGPCKYDKNALECPICHKSDSLISILYGFPLKEAMEAAERGEIKLGGCEVTDCLPSRHCKRDLKDF